MSFTIQTFVVQFDEVFGRLWRLQNTWTKCLKCTEIHAKLNTFNGNLSVFVTLTGFIVGENDLADGNVVKSVDLLLFQHKRASNAAISRNVFLSICQKCQNADISVVYVLVCWMRTVLWKSSAITRQYKTFHSKRNGIHQLNIFDLNICYFVRLKRKYNWNHKLLHKS